MTRLLLVVAALVAAGVGAGAEWNVYHGDSIQDAIDDAGRGYDLCACRDECMGMRMCGNGLCWTARVRM